MVIAGLDPAIHEATPQAQPQGNTAKNLIMDARVKPAHDESKIGAAGMRRNSGSCPGVSRLPWDGSAANAVRPSARQQV